MIFLEENLADLRYVWRGDDGLVHIIAPVLDGEGTTRIRYWLYLCGGKTLSQGLKEREPGAVVTCLGCLGARI